MRSEQARQFRRSNIPIAWNARKTSSRPLLRFEADAEQVGFATQKYTPVRKGRAGQESVGQFAASDFLEQTSGIEHHRDALFSEDKKPIADNCRRSLYRQIQIVFPNFLAVPGVKASNRPAAGYGEYELAVADRAGD